MPDIPLALSARGSIATSDEASVDEPNPPASSDAASSSSEPPRAADGASSLETAKPTTIRGSTGPPNPNEVRHGIEEKIPNENTGIAKRQPKQTKKPTNSQDQDRPSVPRSERLGVIYHGMLSSHIRERKGQYIQLDDGSLHVVLDGRRIPLRFDRNNPELARLLLKATGILTDLSTGAQAALRRLEVDALERAGRIRLKKFSALSPDGQRIYIPLEGGQLLQLSPKRIDHVRNGDNADHFWLEHPSNAPLQYQPGDPMEGLSLFERLVVETQACQSPSMRWFVAFAAGLFPFIRDSCPARLILVLIGPSQSGKTSGAQRFTLLHGLGDVKGDYSVAALSSLCDIGLLVLDNREQANFNQQLIDFCLFLATGAERGRSQVDGRLRTSNPGRPVAVVTTIEGLVKKELRARTVEIPYGVDGTRIQRAPIERQINERRHQIGSALMPVLVRYLQLRMESPRRLPNPIPEFEEYFSAICYLAIAYGEIAGNATEWSEDLIQDWNRVILGGASEEEEEDLEHPILRLLDQHLAMPDRFNDEEYEYQNRAGRLYVATASELLTMLQELRVPNLTLPLNPQGLSHRLADSRFRAFTFFKTDTEGMPQLKRKSGRKPIGFFRPHDDPDAS